MRKLLLALLLALALAGCEDVNAGECLEPAEQEKLLWDADCPGLPG